MENLIKAFQIFLKYRNVKYPTHCEHDVMMVFGYTENEISDEDKKELDELGFFWDNEYDCWASYKYGSS